MYKLRTRNYIQGKKLGLRTNQQALKVGVNGARTPLNQIKRESSSFRLTPRLYPNWYYFQTNLALKENTVRLMRDRWWFSFARFIIKETKSSQINRTTSRTVRWPVWNLVRGSIRIMQGETLVLSCVDTNKERAIGDFKINRKNKWRTKFLR